MHYTLKKAKKPNIILILVDDMGYSDIGCYGGEIQTPNLDKLADDGIKFTQFYNTARCCPTRASIMTGLHPHQTGIGHMTNVPENSDHDLGAPGYRGFLNNNCVTIGEVLLQDGYHTYISGKWHLGMHGQEKWPLQRGFERFYGLLPGACSYCMPSGGRGIMYGNEPVEIKDPDYYTTDAFTDYAIKFIDEQEDDKPFFLYLPYNAPHWPLQAKEKDVEKYKERYDCGWDKLREERY
ncbi:MAG: sulfatase-like hydrolase/transferase, partial [Clostridia bacterium]|nr:sulfatase-like hydrolase/transferase [Clostridia bacterium]